MRYLLLLSLFLLPLMANADSVRVAVAANFASPLRTLVALYQRSYPQADIQLTVASTGKLAAQIRQGAPYDIFLSADNRRPLELAREGWLKPETVRTYAQGVLVVWTPRPGVPITPQSLRQGSLHPVALANARTAPYGQAAQAVLSALQVPKSVTLVRAENVGQSYHFAHSGAAAAAFVALSQVLGQGGSQWQVPTSLYPPILQQGGLLNDTPDASQFYDFLFSAAAQQQIEASGYRVIHAQ